ncbi:hypothetical protein [Pseudomonas zhanjiangensis]|uniref:Uncharacterized protein n=1 Tax=Pseudomonas zhanjiangensis TaxID=3239015 RepID=A0ABV3YST6_9PSED
MNRSSTHSDRTTVIPALDDEWPRDFDFREAYAEQRELLQPLASAEDVSTNCKGAECDD